MRREKLACDTCAVRNRAACAALDEKERAELARLGHRRTLKRGEIVFAAGDRSAVCATLTKGVLKVANFDPDGTEHIVALIHPAGFVGELFAPATNHDVVALTDCELCVFPREEYERAIVRFPELGRALLRGSSSALAESRALLAAVTGRNATQRVAGLISSLSHAASEAECHPASDVDLVLSRGEIASMLGLTIETVSRQFTKLEKDGVISRNGLRGIRITDAAHLGRLAA